MPQDGTRAKGIERKPPGSASCSWRVPAHVGEVVEKGARGRLRRPGELVMDFGIDRFACGRRSPRWLPAGAPGEWRRYRRSGWGGRRPGSDAGGNAATGAAGCVDVDRDGDCSADDCDDENAGGGPSASETCGNGFDDDCDGEVDEGCLDATGFFVDRDSLGGPCADSNPGTQAEPWCTIAEANDRLTSGQTFISARHLCGWTIARSIRVRRTGARITYINYADEEVTLQGASTVSPAESVLHQCARLHFLDCGRNVYLDASHHKQRGVLHVRQPRRTRNLGRVPHLQRVTVQPHLQLYVLALRSGVGIGSRLAG